MNNTDSLPRANIGGILLSALLISGGGLLVGAAASLVSRFFYLLILFPLGMGLLGALIIKKCIHSQKIRLPLLGIAFGILAGVVIYGSYHYGNYLQFRYQVTTLIDEKLVNEYGRASDREYASEIVDLALEEETGYTQFVGYILLVASEGISIGDLGSSHYINIGSFLTWIYWAVELGIIAWLGIKAGFEQTRHPFCEVHDCWYGKEEYQGGVDNSKAKELLDLVELKDFSSAGRLLVETPDLPGDLVYTQGCPACFSGDVWFSIKHAIKGQKGQLQFKQLLRKTITSSQKRELVQEIEAARKKVP